MEAERCPPYQGKCFLDAAIATILTATHDSSRKVYHGQWQSFASCCRERDQNPVCTSVKHVLDFLQSKSKVLAVNTMKGYVTGISRRHAVVHGNPLSLDPSIKGWLKGLKNTKGIPHMIAPTWCLELVLATLGQEPFKPITTCCLKYPTWKTTFLLAMTSGHRVLELHALCCKPLYIWFTPAGVTLFTRLGFLP